MLVLQHSNPASIVDGKLVIDRKFLTGMELYVRSLAMPMVSIHPAARAGQAIMDPVEVPLASLPFDVLTLNFDGRGRLDAGESRRLREVLAQAGLLYGAGFDGSALCLELGVPVIAVLEYDLPTQIAVTAAEVSSPVRKLSRALRTTWAQLRTIPALARAAAVHCNGYPVYRDASRVNANCLLYLDSRLAHADVIDAPQLDARLSRLGTRPLRLLFTGRYETIKGAVDAVQAAADCIARGIDVELVCYGQGSLGPAMRQIAASCRPGAITIHDAIPYPQLQVLAKGFDLFVCCHVQSDPSCTYLESHGAGLPIVGYDNRMWRNLRQASQAGVGVPIGKTEMVVQAVADYAADSKLLSQHSRRAREFALEHCFEAEFRKRTDDIKAHINAAPPRPVADN